MAEKIQLKRDEVTSNYSGLDHFDLVIIGSGISGLSSGLMWLKNTENKKTLIIEKNSYPGGYSTANENTHQQAASAQIFTWPLWHHDERGAGGRYAAGQEIQQWELTFCPCFQVSDYI